MSVANRGKPFYAIFTKLAIIYISNITINEQIITQRTTGEIFRALISEILSEYFVKVLAMGVCSTTHVRRTVRTSACIHVCSYLRVHAVL